MSNEPALIPITPSAVTLPFGTDLLAGQLRPSSQAMYNRDIAAYLIFSEGQGLDPSSAATLARWRLALASKELGMRPDGSPRHYSPNTINRMLSAVKRLMREAAEQGLIDYEIAETFKSKRGVDVKAMKEDLRPHARTYIAPEAMRQLIGLADLATLKGKRDAALLHTMASSGIRLAEVANLKQEHIKWATVDGKSGWILEVCGKTDEQPREAPLNLQAKLSIDAWLAARPVVSPYIFTAADGRGNRWTGRPMTSQGIELQINRYADRAGLQHIKPHDFRRFVGTQLAIKDIRLAQKALGHKSIETTARHYVLDQLEPGITDLLY